MNLAPTLNRIAAAALLALAGSAQAAIVNGADVGGFRTFVDTSTGTVWADLDNHFVETSPGSYSYRFADYDEYLDALTAAGFVWAFAGNVALLHQAYPLATTGIATVRSTMTTLSFLSGGEIGMLSGYSEYFSGDSLRQFASYDPSTATAWWADSGIGAQLPTALEASGLWAYLASPGGGGGGGGSVPLPGTLALAGLGLAAMAGRRRATA